MIVRQFLQWVRSAQPSERADATSALARAYLYAELSTDDRAAAEGAMIMMLDDPSPLVRQALAEAFASAQAAPPVILDALAADQPQVSVPILARSPLLRDADLIDLVATGPNEAQVAIAGRASMPRSLAAAIAEVGCAEACLVLLENLDADIAQFSIDRMVERFGHLAPIRENLLDRDDLPATTRQALVSMLSQTLACFVSARQWLGTEHAAIAAKEACERATIALAAETPYDEIAALVAHLRESGQLTTGMILRGLLSGNVVLFAETLAELSNMPLDRVTSYIHDKSISGFQALYLKAGLPEDAYPAFREAVAAMREGVLMTGQGNAARLKRGMVERVLEGCSAMSGADESMLALLKLFLVEAAREEARTLCDDLVATSPARPSVTLAAEPAPEDMAANDVAMTSIAPVDLVSDDVAPEEFTPESTALVELAANDVASADTALADMMSHGMTPVTLSLDIMTLVEMAANDTSLDGVAQDDTTPEHMVPADMVPEDVAPEEMRLVA
jgi:uncharacterized protein (DUF2336 family)